MTVGIISFPGIPANAQTALSKKTVVQKESLSESDFWLWARITSYSWREPDHVPFGKHNCQGGDLTVPVEGLQQCAADLKFYPLGTILCIKTGDVEEFRIVTDCGKAVKGPHHLDIHFDSIEEMNNHGTRKAQVMVIRRGWNFDSQVGRQVL